MQDLMTSLQVAEQNLLPVITASCFFNIIHDVRDGSAPAEAKTRRTVIA